LLHVHFGKGHKDRYVPLPQRQLELLRDFWRSHRHPIWLFPRHHTRLSSLTPHTLHRHLRDHRAVCVLPPNGWVQARGGKVMTRSNQPSPAPSPATRVGRRVGYENATHRYENTSILTYF
jgi:integrase